ncbi:regulatory signaling modulator protein AmpE [Escherichia coli]|nr:regulatory signaling modulator protein AmpE [Escherichia coli]
MTLIAVAVAFCISFSACCRGICSTYPLLVLLLIFLLCIGAGKVRLHYHAYLTAASRNDSRAACHDGQRADADSRRAAGL